MVLIGNILLGLTTAFFLLFAFELYTKPARIGGDGAIGMAYTVFLFHLVLFVCAATVAGFVGQQGKFSWAGSSGASRFLCISAGLMLATIGSLFASYRDGPILNTWMGPFAQVVITVLLITGLAGLLNNDTPPTTYRLSLLVAAALGMVVCLPIVWITLKNKVENTVASVQAMGQPDSNDIRMTQEVEAFDVSQGIANLLIFTDFNKDMSVREPALAKLKSCPDWQEQLVQGLRERWAPEVFTFLAGNDVDDKNMFAEPIGEGIRMQALLIREKLGEASQSHHLYEDQFMWEVERVLRTLKKFKDNGTDYRPMMLEFREAFNAPCSVKKPKFTCLRYLDNWLKM
ncbi:MAG: hypothetical protein ACKVU2_09145 [Saprospiraceae bacterium]